MLESVFLITFYGRHLLLHFTNIFSILNILLFYLECFTLNVLLFYYYACESTCGKGGMEFVKHRLVQLIKVDAFTTCWFRIRERRCRLSRGFQPGLLGRKYVVVCAHQRNSVLISKPYA